MIRQLLLVTALFLTSNASSSETLGFKSVPFGSPLKIFQTAFPDFDCRTEGTCFYNMSSCSKPGTVINADCIQRNTWAGIVLVSAMASFKEGQLDSVYLTIHPSNYVKAVDSGKERLGQPTEELTPVVQTRAGAQLQGGITRWIGDDTVLVITKYGSSIDQGSVSIRTRASYNQMMDRSKSSPKAGAKDM
jgi:hypothetical protein